jgi:hypothetical protein
MLLPRFLRRENRAWPSWHGFGHSLGGAPCLVPFRGKGDDDSRADEHPPELHAGIAAADQPGSAQLGRARARHLLGRDLPDRRGADCRDVVPDRHRLSPRRLSRARPYLVLRPARRPGGQHLRRIQSLPPRIPAAELLQLQGARPAHDPALERDADLSVDARLSGADQRRLFARLDRAVLHHDARRADRRALCHRARHRDGARGRVNAPCARSTTGR